MGLAARDDLDGGVRLVLQSRGVVEQVAQRDDAATARPCQSAGERALAVAVRRTVAYLGKMLTARRDLKPSFLILCVTAMGSCFSTPEPPEPDTASAEQRISLPPELTAPAREQLAAHLALEPDPAVRAALVARAKDRAEWAARNALGVSNDSYTEGGHCNVRLTQCDP
jgi:hypothetical protein